MDRRKFISLTSLTTAHLATAQSGFSQWIRQNENDFAGTPSLNVLKEKFLSPGQAFQPGCYWWWFNGLVDKQGITRDLEEFKAKGMGEVLLINSADGLGGARMPQGVKFLSPEWRELFRYSLQEAHRLGIKMGVNMSSGWCMGGPWIPPQHACRWFLQSRLTVSGPQKFSGKLPLPGNRDGYDKLVNAPGWKEYIDLPIEQIDYRDTAIVAIPAGANKNPLKSDKRAALFPAKTNRKDASNFIKANDVMGPVSTPWEAMPGDQPIAVDKVIDLTDKVKADGQLDWDVPAGEWTIIRTGHRMTGSKVMIAQPEASGLSVDWLSRTGVDLQFENLGKILIQEAGDLAGKTLVYLCDDSFEDGFPNWTENIITHFKKYRGYDPVPYLPVLNGFIIGNIDMCDRFLNDYRKTVADCLADEHYKHFADLCHRNGLQVQNEAAGPSRSGTMCMDALKNLGRSDMPQGEFWLGGKHDEEGGLDEKLGYGMVRLEGGQNKVTKMVSSAAHIYGKKTASAESFTSFRHWYDYPGNMKQAADRAFCEGINRFLIHTSTATRVQDGKPGYEYGAGTHFNPNVTWWNQAGPFLDYISRCQYILQQGLFVADILYYNGDIAPNIVLPKHVDPSAGKGFDYDVCNEEVLLTRLNVKNGKLVLPDGMSYRILVLPDTTSMPVPVLEKIKALVAAGATIIGPRPQKDSGLKDYPNCDVRIKVLADAVWGKCDGKNIKQHLYGKGKIFWNVPLKEVLQEKGVGPDFICDDENAFIDFIHRTTDDTDIYFVANRNKSEEKLSCRFRNTGSAPEIWDAVTGKMMPIKTYSQAKGYTSIPLEFAPFQSWFIVFKKGAAVKKQAGKPAVSNFLSYAPVQELTGAWKVHFDTAWGGPATVEFAKLEDWTQRPEEGIKYYSGSATYVKQFDAVNIETGKRYFLETGVVKNIAELTLNGKKLGVLWTDPWRVEVTEILKATGNVLEIVVVNCWPNRLIGDAGLPPEKRRTRTNISFKKDAPLMPSGLLGPVRILRSA
ncbi:glycosyl hydrolase [Longitalea luteola]|uniref:glycosyl hydrolase n=1 Tax=Longitalea luteola TaxID=2812563 RepID=UPI001A963F26|nr:glycosyl hydrolase [Longitalea luteola]